MAKPTTVIPAMMVDNVEVKVSKVTQPTQYLGVLAPAPNDDAGTYVLVQGDDFSLNVLATAGLEAKAWALTERLNQSPYPFRLKLGRVQYIALNPTTLRDRDERSIPLSAVPLLENESVKTLLWRLREFTPVPLVAGSIVTHLTNDEF